MALNNLLNSDCGRLELCRYAFQTTFGAQNVITYCAN